MNLEHKIELILSGLILVILTISFWPKERVIVKRHRNSKYFEGIKPSFSIKGRVLRYDVYKPELN